MRTLNPEAALPSFSDFVDDLAVIRDANNGKSVSILFTPRGGKPCTVVLSLAEVAALLEPLANVIDTANGV